MTSDPETPLTTRQKVNLETARIDWNELQRYFAMGRLIVVDSNLDLVDTAADFVDDNSEKIKTLLETEKVRKADTENARVWNERQPRFWAVVAAPWVLVQEETINDQGE